MNINKPLGQRAYGHIFHLPGSKMGTTDRLCNQGQADIVLKKTRDEKDLIISQEKLDGSCVAVCINV